jgi:hypothetical protein
MQGVNEVASLMMRRDCVSVNTVLLLLLLLLLLNVLRVYMRWQLY